MFSPTRQSNSLLGIFVWTYAFSLAFDFKGPEAGGSLFQYLIVGMALVSGFGIFFLHRIPSFRGAGIQFNFLLLAICLFFIVAFVSQLINQNPEFYFLRILLPYVLFGMSFFVVLKLATEGFPMGRFISILAWACLVAAIFRIFYALMVLHIALNTARWEILSSGVPYLIAYGMVHILVNRKWNYFGIFAFVIGISCALLSVTRSYLFTITLCFFGAVICIRAHTSALNIKLMPSMIAAWKKLVLVLIIGIAAIAMTVSLRQEILENWNLRLHQREEADTSKDISWLCREAAMQGMIDEMTTVESWILGKGFGGAYFWSLDYRPELINSMTSLTFYEENRLPSDTFWVYQIFAVGLTGACCLFYVFGGSLILGYRQIKRIALVIGHQPNRCVPFVASLGFLGQTFTASPVAERFGAVIFGASLALMSLPLNPRPMRRHPLLAKNRRQVVFKAANTATLEDSE